MLKENKAPINSKILVTLFGLAAIGLGFLVLTNLNSDSAPALNSNSVSSNANPDPDTNLEVAPILGSIAPDFSLVDLAGQQVKLSDFKGQPVVVNFWATWCAPCRIEMPALQSRFEAHQASGLTILAVDFDEPVDDVREFRDEFGLTFSLLLDPGAEIQKLYRNRAYPTTYFIDGDGVIQVQHFGAMTEGQLDANLAKIGVGS